MGGDSDTVMGISQSGPLSSSAKPAMVIKDDNGIARAAACSPNAAVWVFFMTLSSSSGDASVIPRPSGTAVSHTLQLTEPSGW